MTPDEILLIEKLNECNIYDLERLKKCFEYEYKTYPEKRAMVGELLRHIGAVMESKTER